MDIEEANKVLEELSKDAKPEMLNDKAKMLFDAIMKIADERDEAKSDLYEANNRINDLLEIVDNKDKIILREKLERQMSEEADKKILEFKDEIINEMGEHIEKGCDFDSAIQTKEQIIDYFTKKVTKEENK